MNAVLTIRDKLQALADVLPQDATWENVRFAHVVRAALSDRLSDLF
jgi:hypothetical protein